MLSFKPLPNTTYFNVTEVFKAWSSVKCQKKGGKTYGSGAIWDLLLHRGGAVFSSSHFWRQATEPRMGKDKKKKWSNCRKHICLLSLQLNYLSREMNFPLRRQADTGPHVQGKSSISIFSLLKRGSQAQEIKALLSNYRELVVTQHKSTISSLFGKATWQWGKITAHVLIRCCLARWFSTVISKLIGNIPTENLCCLYITEKL